MRQYDLLQKYGKLTFFTGTLTLLLVLFFQPLEPIRFLEAAFHSSYTVSSSTFLHVFFIPMFRLALFMVTISAVGFYFCARKKRLLTSEAKASSGQYDSANEGEENWIFI